jgi:hypothetical protein
MSEIHLDACPTCRAHLPRAPANPARVPGGKPVPRTPTLSGPHGPPEAPPLPKTQPAPPKTQPLPSKPPPRHPTTEVTPPPSFPVPPPRPRKTNPTFEDLTNDYERAKDALDNAQHETVAATGDFIRYRDRKPNPGRGHPGDPSWHPTMDEGLENDARLARENSGQKLMEFQDARDAWRAAGGVEPPPPPNFPGCPPNCGNSNITMSAPPSGSGPNKLGVGFGGLGGP